MAPQQQRSERLPLPAQDDNWDDRLARVRRNGAPVVIEEQGHAVAALVSVRDYGRLRRLDDARRRLFTSIDRIQDAFAEVPLDEIEREVARAIRDIRREDPAKAGQTLSS